ncbi:hexameric tyrosine-coordinated heme protein [Micromonospora musae]|uniref:hexameric tyrosine-coordinated heme protein n=1 Tax=Micromonospora musae TaxID=1894970 RepID=UPI00341E6017
MSDSWLPALRTASPEEGFQLAIKLSRVGVKMTQPSAEVRERLRPEYAENADSLIASSQVIALNFQTVAQANDFWRS